MNQLLSRPMAKPLNLVVEGDKFRAAGRWEGADVGRSQIVEAAASAVAESKGHGQGVKQSPRVSVPLC